MEKSQNAGSSSFAVAVRPAANHVGSEDWLSNAEAFAPTDFLQFKPPVRCIKDPASGRFILLNLNKIQQDFYPVFQPDEAALLKLIDGISLADLKEQTRHPDLEEYLAFFRKHGYFDQPRDVRALISEVREGANNQYRTISKIIQADVEDKLAQWRKDDARPWSAQKAHPGSAKIEVSLLVSDLCNLQCRYCHVLENLEPAIRNRTGRIMDLATLEAFGQGFFRYIKARYGTGCLNVVFFGGQPALMGKVRRFLFEAAEKLALMASREKLFINFAIDDNGTQIDDELLEFYRKYDFDITFSFDTPAEVNSIHRPYPGLGRASGPVVEEGLRRLLDGNAKVGLRATVSSLNQDRIVEAIDYYWPWGLRCASFVPMQDVAHGKKVTGLFSPDPSVLGDELKRAFDYVVHLYQEKGITFELGPITSLLHSIIEGGTIQSCGMGDIYFAVDPDGEVFTCHRDLIDEYRITNVKSPDFLERMLDIPVQKTCPPALSLLEPEIFCETGPSCSCKSHVRPQCRDCEALIFCGGVCPGASRAQYGCVNHGASMLLDSDPALDDKRCQWSKDLIKDFLWRYIDADHRSPFSRYVNDLFGDLIR